MKRHIRSKTPVEKEVDIPELTSGIGSPYTDLRGAIVGKLVEHVDADNIIETRGIDVTLDMEQPHIMDVPGYYEDWCIFSDMKGSDGKRYFMTNITTLGCGRRLDYSSFLFNTEPLRSYSLGRCYDGMDEGPQTAIHVFLPRGAAQIDSTEDSVSITVANSEDSVKVTCAPPTWQTSYSGANMTCNLTYRSRGPAVGPYPNIVKITPTSNGTAYWSFADVSGDLTIGDTVVHLEGRAIIEHVWMEAMVFEEMQWMDWMWFHFDQAYGLFFRTVAVGGYSEWQVTLCLPEEQKCLPTEDCSISYSGWKYVPSMQHFIPTEMEVTMKTEIGTLELKADAYLIQPVSQFRIYDWTPRASYCMVNAAYEFSGTFTYNNGTVVQLGPGTGHGGNQVVQSDYAAPSGQAIAHPGV